MQPALCLGLLLSPAVTCFTPWLTSNVEKCSEVGYNKQKSVRSMLRRFDANFGEAAFADGGDVGLLSGGIEIAIHPLFCTRILGLPDTHKDYKARCDLLTADIQHGAQAWSNRHPSLYFNWTRPITNIEAAEVVISTDWEVFLKESGIAYVAPLGYTKLAAYKHSTDEEQVGFTGAEVSTLWKTRKIRSTARSGSVTHGLSARVGRYELFVNPYNCYYSTQAHGRVCGAEGLFGIGWPNTLALLALVGLLALLALVVVHRRPSMWRSLVMAQIVVFVVVCLATSMLYRSACTNGTSVLELRFFKSYLRDVSDVEPGKHVDLHKCLNFQQIISHELGHVLGMGHPDSLQGGYYNRPNWLNQRGEHIAHAFTPIDAHNPCQGVRHVKQPLVCESLSLGDCVAHKECRVAKWRCLAVTADTIMYAYAHHTDRLGTNENKNYITEDDLASMFFLYPHHNRTSAWGTAALPMSEYSLAKLRALSEDFMDHACATLETKVDVLECLQEKKAEQMLSELRGLASDICRQPGRQDECREMAGLFRVATLYLDSIRHGRLTDGMR